MARKSSFVVLPKIIFNDDVEAFLKKNRIKTKFIANIKSHAAKKVALWNSTATKDDGWKEKTLAEQIKMQIQFINEAGAAALYTGFAFNDFKDANWNQLASDFEKEYLSKQK